MIYLATELDMLIDRLERLSMEINDLKRMVLPVATRGTPLAPFSPAIGRASSVIDPLAREAYFGAVRGTVQALEDAPENFRKNNPIATIQKAKRKRSKAQKANDKLQSEAFKQANKALRTAKGVLRKGKTQADVARRAQRLLRKMKKK